MDVVVPAVTGDLVSRFISFLINKCRNQTCLVEKLERLQQLLLRVHTIVEEAEGRNITNSRMLIQLSMLVKALYRGYHVLDTFKCMPLEEISAEEEVSSSYALSITTPIKRFYKTTKKSMPDNHELERALETLETLVNNMAEFAILLGGCERMFRRPYDTYLYIDNFMFGCHVEKQQVINTLLEKKFLDLGASTVIPIISGCRFRNGTLVTEVCNDERVRSHFSSILHFNGDNALSRINSEKFVCVRTLVVIEFASDVEDKDWAKFNMSATHMGRGSKVILISTIERLARLGTVKPIRLNCPSHEEYSYLFKTLAFGSTNPEDHCRLASIAKEFATMLGGSLIPANVLADVLRKNLNVKFWLCVLRRFRKVVEDNLLMFGETPKLLLDKGHPIDITSFASLSCDATLHLMPPRYDGDVSKRGLPRLTFEDLIVGRNVPSKGEFVLEAWQLRVPPYTKLILTATCVENKPQCTAMLSKRRRQ